MTNELTVDGYKIDDVLTKFVDTKGEKQIILIDKVDWPFNKHCAN